MGPNSPRNLELEEERKRVEREQELAQQVRNTNFHRKGCFKQLQVHVTTHAELLPTILTRCYLTVVANIPIFTSILQPAITCGESTGLIGLLNYLNRRRRTLKKVVQIQTAKTLHRRGKYYHCTAGLQFQDSTASPHSNNKIFSYLVKCNLIKLETSHTVILTLW